MMKEPHLHNLEPDSVGSLKDMANSFLQQVLNARDTVHVLLAQHQSRPDHAIALVGVLHSLPQAQRLLRGIEIMTQLIETGAMTDDDLDRMETGLDIELKPELRPNTRPRVHVPEPWVSSDNDPADPAEYVTYELGNMQPCAECQQLLNNGYGVPVNQSKLFDSLQEESTLPVVLGEEITTELRTVADTILASTTESFEQSYPESHALLGESERLLLVGLAMGLEPYLYPRNRVPGDPALKVVLHSPDNMPLSARSHNQPAAPRGPIN